MPSWQHKPSWMPDYAPTNKEQKAYEWCMDNGIRISPQGISNNPREYKIAINNGGGWNLSPPYSVDIVWKKLYEFCLYYYNKSGVL